MLQLVALMLLPQQALEPVAQGVASYYTVASSSPLTASGDLLNDAEFTCAMPEGDFGSYCLVVADNGRCVVCKLNDRGPFIKDRVIDLSEAAMRQLHDTAGLVRVKVYRLQLDGLSVFFSPN